MPQLRILRQRLIERQDRPARKTEDIHHALAHQALAQQLRPIHADSHTLRTSFKVLLTRIPWNAKKYPSPARDGAIDRRVIPRGTTLLPLIHPHRKDRGTLVAADNGALPSNPTPRVRRRVRARCSGASSQVLSLRDFHHMPRSLSRAAPATTPLQRIPSSFGCRTHPSIPLPDNSVNEIFSPLPLPFAFAWSRRLYECLTADTRP